MTLWRHWIVGQLDASIAAALLLAIAVLLRHRLSPSVRSAILLIALVRLVLPPWLRSPWSEALVDLPAIDDGRTLLAMVMQADVAMYIAAFTTAVTVFLLARLAWTFTRVSSRWLLETTPAPTPRADGACAARSGSVEIRISPANEGPFAVGLRRKLIVLPASVLELDRAAFDAVVAHELAHHERRDLWWIALAEGVKAIAWFNPLSHVIARALIASREDGSDDWAISKTSNDPFTYARALLQSARMIAEPRPLGVAGAHPMGKRLRRLLDHGTARDKRPGLFGAAVIVLCAAAAIPGAHMPSLTDYDTDNNRRIVIVIKQ